MTFRNPYLFIIFSVVCILGMIFQLRQHYKKVDDFDMPKQLSGKKEVIDLKHIDRDCDCPEWSPGGPGENGDSTQYIYIEGAYSNMEVPATYWALADSGYLLRLHGEFYNGKAIPYDYTQKKDQKPEKARVFYYTQFEVVKQE